MAFVLKNGGRNELWARSADSIKKFLAKNAIKPLDAKTVDQMAGGVIIDGLLGQGLGEYFCKILGSNAPRVATTKSTKITAIERLWPYPFPGGIKGPHIHFQGEVYLLSETQWREFSGKIMEDIQGRISRANVVGFDQLMNIDEATANFI